MNLTERGLSHLIHDVLDIQEDFMRLDASSYEIATSGLTPRGVDYRGTTKKEMARSLALRLHAKQNRGITDFTPYHFGLLIDRFGLRPSRDLMGEASTAPRPNVLKYIRGDSKEMAAARGAQ